MNNHIKHLENGDFEVIPLDDPEFLEAQKKREEELEKSKETNWDNWKPNKDLR